QLFSQSNRTKTLPFLILASGFEKINGNFVCSFEVKQIDEKLRDRFLNQLLESHKAIIFQTKEKGTELFTLP
ncbi:MAG: hypothetical protein VXY27_00550, partial [Thermoproteota archaeon]|nr:hypothetical protein [Thermoproteota archaeon]